MTPVMKLGGGNSFFFPIVHPLLGEMIQFD